MLSGLLVIVGLFPEIYSSFNHTHTHAWNYDDELTWPGQKCHEGGKRQSPINIRTQDVNVDYNEEYIKYGDLKLQGYDKVLLTGVNNGHTIQFSTEGQKDIHPTITGGPLEHIYRMEQLHFHWLSEHAVDGHKFPMEIHFVHIRADLSVEQALREKNGLAVLAVFSNVEADAYDKDEAEQSLELTKHIISLMDPGDRISGLLFDTTKLLSPNPSSFFTYAGSLTSPECNEVVQWIIFEKPTSITDSQYRLLSKIWRGRHNFRSLQPIKRHEVYQNAPPSIWSTPSIVATMINAYRSVADAFSDINGFVKKHILKKD